jgi:uncharacterized protein
VDSNISKENRQRVTGGHLRQMLATGTALLQENVTAVNDLNVFPVPDGDTGTNMLLTMQSALEEVSRVAGDDFGAVAHAMAHGALMGARGNSGVILSQILRGIARSAGHEPSLDAARFAAALKEGANTAYRGIGKPVEGTMLTVAREAADAAVATAAAQHDIVEMLRSALETAKVSLENTPNLLPVLKEAGVVDAGGQGYLLILHGWQMLVSGERSAPSISLPRKGAIRSSGAVSSGEEYGYCTEILIRGESPPIEEIRTRCEQLGTSVIVVGDEDLVHLHAHTYRPGDVINLAVDFGSLEKVKVENMQLQHTAFVGRVGPSGPEERPDIITVVAVAAGEGLAQVFRDLGAAGVVPGGQTMNPSIEELVRGITHTGAANVILLPNNPNVLLTAQQAQGLVESHVNVVPTRTMCEGVAAMVAFNPEADLDSNLAAMTEAAKRVHTIELTRAVRSTRVNGLKVKEGQVIGLLNGALVQTGSTPLGVALDVLERAGAGAHEIVTVYYGDGADEDEARELAESIAGRWPDLQVDVVHGGQPHYPFIISVE